MTPNLSGNLIDTDAPIGMFDSGIGALSVLRHIRMRLPHENLLCFADSGNAPYGSKSDEKIIERTLAVASFLLAHHAKAIVVACNTATAAAIGALRQRYPDMIVVGVEPGLKPAAVISKTKIVGVLATTSTLNSTRFHALRDQYSEATGVQFLLQPCVGLVNQIEKGELASAETEQMLQRYVTPLLRGGADTLVLGCTHYPFVQPLIETIVRRETDRPIAIIDTSEAVARQLQRQLVQHGLQRTATSPGSLQAFTSGSKAALVRAFAHLLQLQPPVTEVAAHTAG